MAEAGTQTRVLVVDDEQSIREIVRGFLERDGMTVLEAADGPSAVEIAREAAPEVVVLDLMLPGFDGLEVLRRIRTFADPYVLLLTARNEEVDRIVGLTVGADDYLTKPFSPASWWPGCTPSCGVADPDPETPETFCGPEISSSIRGAARSVRLASPSI